VSRSFVTLVLLLLLVGFAGAKNAQENHAGTDPKATRFVDCTDSGQPKRVFGPLSYSPDGQWRAYVQVDVAPGDQCLHTSRIWLSRRTEPFRLVYLISPERWNTENGIELLGWSADSKMLLVLTEKWQYASDTGDQQAVVGIDAITGMLYPCDFAANFQDDFKNKQCIARVTDAGFDASHRFNILVRGKITTEPDVDETLEDVPAEKRCADREEVWNFSFFNGEVSQVPATATLHIFKKFRPNPHSK
jgi:hypothetical protein